jgi:hypothetical protein
VQSVHAGSDPSAAHKMREKLFLGAKGHAVRQYRYYSLPGGGEGTHADMDDFDMLHRGTGVH